jgi:hypothetical protein
MSAAQEHGRRAHVILGTTRVLTRPRRNRRMGQAAHDADVVLEGLERRQDFGQREALAGRRGSPLVHRRAVRAGIIESNNGNAIAAPAPRSKVRRDKCFSVVNMSSYGAAVAALGRGDERRRIVRRGARDAGREGGDRSEIRATDRHPGRLPRGVAGD